MKTHIFPVRYRPSEPARYTVVCVRCRGQWLLVRHRARTTWEFPGGHIEPGESIEQAALRELNEETGLTGISLIKVCDYYAGDEASGSWGRIFLGFSDKLPESMTNAEMAEWRLFDSMWENTTYPDIIAVTFKAVQFFLYTQGWVSGERETILAPLSEEAEIREYHGPVMQGVSEIGLWVDDWLRKGRVLRWDIEDISVDTVRNTLFAKWTFACEYENKPDTFDGASLVAFAEDNRIMRIDEYYRSRTVQRPYKKSQE